MKLRSTRFATAAVPVALAAVGVSIAFGPSGIASGADSPPTTQALPGVHVDRLPADKLPLATTVQQVTGGVVTDVVNLAGGGASYTEVTVVDIDGTNYVVDIYQIFSADELYGAGLASTRTVNGTRWIGAQDPDLTSIYYLSDDGIGLWIGYSSAKPIATPLDRIVDELTAFAERLSASSSVQQEVER